MSETSKQNMPYEMPEQKVPQNPERGYAYFRDDQITFLVSHQTGTVSGNQLEEFVNEINSLLGGRTVSWPPRTFSFPAITADDYIQRQTQLKNLESPLPGQCAPSTNEPEPLMSAFSIIVSIEAPEGEPRMRMHAG
jgi:hypothetical protein